MRGFIPAAGLTIQNIVFVCNCILYVSKFGLSDVNNYDEIQSILHSSSIQSPDSHMMPAEVIQRHR